MLENALNEFNPHGLLSAIAARDISDRFAAYRMIAKFNELVYEAATKGRYNAKYEVIRSSSYEACKAYQLNETVNQLINDCKKRGYEAYFMLHQDDKTDEYYGELLISWEDKTKKK